MIGDIVEIARARAALDDVMQLPPGAHAAEFSIGPKPELESIRTDEGGASNLPRSGWAAFARMAAWPLPGSG